MNKLHIKNNQIISRSYNQISFRGNKVIKGAPKNRHTKEIEWFKEAKKIIPDNIPQIYRYNKNSDSTDNSNLKYYEMQAINGSNLYQWALKNKDSFPKMLNKLIQLTNRLHIETFSPKQEDIFRMYLLKPKKALVNFLNNNNISPNNIVINNHEFSDPVSKLEETYKQLKNDLLDTKYSFIHGDLTMSNTLIDNKENLYLIDPRGGFGKTKIYGDIRYDIAKIYYSVVGNFDSLNTGNLNYQKENQRNNSHKYSIIDNGLGNYEGVIIKKFGENIRLIRFIHATIWLSLIPHVANDQKQQFCTFCHGVYLINNINEN